MNRVQFLSSSKWTSPSQSHSVFVNMTSGDVVTYTDSRRSCGAGNIGKYAYDCVYAFQSSSLSFDADYETIVSVSNYHSDDEIISRASGTGRGSIYDIFCLKLLI